MPTAPPGLPRQCALQHQPGRRVPLAVIHPYQRAKHLPCAAAGEGGGHRLRQRPHAQVRMPQHRIHLGRAGGYPELQMLVKKQRRPRGHFGVIRVRVGVRHRCDGVHLLSLCICRWSAVS
jgi:hypothetical protein